MYNSDSKYDTGIEVPQNILLVQPEFPIVNKSKHKSFPLENKQLGNAIYWCPTCNVPLLSAYCNKCGSEGAYCASDLKPVFQKEKRMYENFLSLKLPDNLFRNKNRVIMDGATLFRYKIDFHQLKLSLIEPLDLVKSRLRHHTPETKKKFMRKTKRSNEKVLKEKEAEAIKFIKSVSKEYRERFKVISFSGGKDSSVTAVLVKKALKKVPLFFSDTTLEFPETHEFVEKFARKYRFELIRDENGKFYRSPQDFFKLCDDLGPPSILYRWCCTVFKAYPVNEFNKKLNRDVLAFDGIRKYESQIRSKYDKVSRIKKIPRQVAAYPIFLWTEADVWFYTLYNKIDYNPLYELGHTRVGCWVCPNASPSNCFFREFTHPELWAKFEKVLEEYAKKYNKDRNWIIDNYWRLRRPKRDNVVAVTPGKPCQSEQSRYTYNFKKPISRPMLEFFKPFGDVIIKEMSQSEVNFFKLESENPFKITGMVNGSTINVSFNPQSFLESKKLFERQLTRALNCVNCGGCVGTCPFGAINIQNNYLTIDSGKCVHCKKCVQSNCMALKYKTERKIIGS